MDLFPPTYCFPKFPEDLVGCFQSCHQGDNHQETNINKSNIKTWVKVPESDSAPVPPCPKHRTDDVSILKPKVGRGADRNEQERHFLMPKRVTTIGTGM